MTPAELLRAAADRIDQSRADATPGPWTASSPAAAVWSVYDPRELPAAEYCDEGDAAWIALLNPQVGGHLAALLRTVAENDFADLGFAQTCTSIGSDALALARAILIEVDRHAAP